MVARWWMKDRTTILPCPDQCHACYTRHKVHHTFICYDAVISISKCAELLENVCFVVEPVHLYIYETARRYWCIIHIDVIYHQIQVKFVWIMNMPHISSHTTVHLCMMMLREWYMYGLAMCLSYEAPHVCCVLGVMWWFHHDAQQVSYMYRLIQCFWCDVWCMTSMPNVWTHDMHQTWSTTSTIDLAYIWSVPCTGIVRYASSIRVWFWDWRASNDNHSGIDMVCSNTWELCLYIYTINVHGVPSE